ncbi:hypothetical protein [Kitasatospora sp. MY 5-36]|uniref:hypothetical protein n=1 Tax=Kitasatospora sp. MY 5-36 TaxID=1678027 RepID=UPI0006717935|nr:hypothetical protein [Kitasatospora sp. MY 5-36]
MIDRILGWWFLRCSRTRLARLLRSERRRLEAELAYWLPEASATVRRWILAAIEAERSPR